MGNAGYFLTISGDARDAASLYRAERLAELVLPRLEAWFARLTAFRIDAEIALAGRERIARGGVPDDQAPVAAGHAHPPTLGTANRPRSRTGVVTPIDFSVARSGQQGAGAPAPREGIPHSP